MIILFFIGLIGFRIPILSLIGFLVGITTILSIIVDTSDSFLRSIGVIVLLLNAISTIIGGYINWKA
jgi:hypothetical protein